MSLCSSWKSAIPLPLPSGCVYNSCHAHPLGVLQHRDLCFSPSRSSWQGPAPRTRFWAPPALEEEKTHQTLLVEGDTHHSSTKHQFIPTCCTSLLPKIPPHPWLCGPWQQDAAPCCRCQHSELPFSMLTTRDAWHFWVEAFQKWQTGLQSKWKRVQKHLWSGWELPGLEAESRAFL